MSATELSEIRRKAAQVKMRPAAFLREHALSRAPVAVPEVNRQAFAELGRAGNNLNQIARRLNERDLVDVIEVHAMLRVIQRAIMGLMAE